MQNIDTNDDPPFNFQKMLRKTDHRRASMKRSKSDQNENDRNGYTSEVILPRYSLNVTSDFNYNDGERIISPTNDVKPLPRARNVVIDKRPMSSGSMKDLGAVYVQEEIHPGVVLEGYSVDI